MIRRRLLAVFAALALGAFGQSAQAAFSGTLALGANTTELNGTNLLATQYEFSTLSANTMVVTGSTGAFTGVVTPFVTLYSSVTLNTLNLTAFSITNATFGTFQAGAGSFVIDQSATELDILLLGTYTGLPSSPGSTPASMLISLNQDAPGGAIGGGSSLAVPPAVPEPASIAMLGLGLISVGGFAARRRMAK